MKSVSALGATSEGGSVQAMMAETEQRETTFLEILSKKLKSEGVSISCAIRKKHSCISNFHEITT